MKYFVKKRIFAVVFLLAMFSFSAVNIYLNKDAFIKEANKHLNEPDKLPSEFEEVMQDEIVGKRHFVEAYGLTQKTLGKKEFNSFEFVKDNNMCSISEFFLIISGVFCI